MTRLLFLCLIWLYPLSSFGAINEYLTDVYYANGMNVDEGNATASTHLLELSILEKIHNGNIKEFKQEIGKVQEAYNSTHGFAFDLIESFMQKLDLQFLIDWYALLKAHISSHLEDIREQINAYKSSIKSGHKVLAVAHSQGNLFTGEAYLALGKESKNAWMQKYFESVSVASPRTKNIKDGTERIDWDNDPVSRIATLGTKTEWMIDNPTRDVEWKDRHPGVPVEKPEQYYVDESNLNKLYGHRWKAVENGLDFSFNVHAFIYYMGECLGGCKNPILNPFNDKPVKTNKAKTKIMTAIKIKLDNMEKVESQWKKKKDIGCGCDRTISLTHVYDSASMDEIVKDVSVMEFNPEGKIYQVDGKLVQASANGIKIKDIRVSEHDQCYLLEGTDEKIKNESTLDPKFGILSASLSWEDPEINLNLSISGPTSGENDIKDVECPNEHWYIANESGVKEGEYYISVDLESPSGIDEDYLPQTVSINVDAPDGGIDFILDIQNINDLNMGNVAKIIVSKPKGGGGGGISIESDLDGKAYGKGKDGLRFYYETIALLNQVKLGPIAGAIFEVNELLGSHDILYSGSTSSGKSIKNNGLMLFSGVLKNAVQNDDLYLIIARGGQDVDRDDDFVMDMVPTENLGKIHAIISGTEIKEGSLKVNIMTEIAYQALRQNEEENLTKIKAALDDVAKRLFKEDINSDQTINRKDLHSWLPRFDKSKLLFDYDDKIEPMVTKIYKNEDIFLDVYKLLYAGDVLSINVDKNNSDDVIQIVLNELVKVPQLKKSDFILKNSHGDLIDFSMEQEGNGIRLQTLEELIDGQTYALSFTLEITDDLGNTYIDSHQHEIIIPDNTPPTILHSMIHVLENQQNIFIDAYDPSTPLQYKIIGGVDREVFNILVNKLSFKEAPNYERPIDHNGDNIYELEISISDSFLNTKIFSIQIIVDDVVEKPELQETHLSVDENVPVGTYVGLMKVVSEGDGQLTNFYFYGREYGDFRIDNEGKIYTKKVFDYERIKSYKVSVNARNSAGKYALAKDVFINVNDIDEPMPALHHFTGSMNEHAEVGKIVGQMYVYPGSGGEFKIELTGNGADDFDINSSGVITVASGANLDYQVRSQYNLTVIGDNGSGNHAEANVTININTWTQQYGTAVNDGAYTIVTDEAYNVYISGSTYGDLDGNGTNNKRTFFVSKFNSSGMLIWTKQYREFNELYLSSLVADKNGTLYLAGSHKTGTYVSSSGYTSDKRAAWIFSLNSSGEILWKKQFGTDDDSSRFANITMDEKGDLLAVGSTKGVFPGYINQGSSDMFFTKLTAQGEVLWIKQFGTSQGDNVRTMKKNLNNELLLLMTNNTVMKFDSSVDAMLWSKTFTSSQEGPWDKYIDLTLDKDDNIYLLSVHDRYWEEEQEYYYDFDSLVMKLNSDGETIWHKRYGSEKYEVPSNIAINSADEIYITGDSRGDFYGNFNKNPYTSLYDEGGDFFLMKINTDGKKIDAKQYGSIDWDGVKGMTIDSMDNIYLTGSVHESLDGNTYLGDNDIFIMKIPD